MATLRKDGRYTQGRRVKGKLIYGYGKTPEEAKEDLETKIASIPSIVELDPEQETLHEFAKRVWFPSIAHLEPLSQAKYTGLYKLHIRDSIGLVRLVDLNYAIVQAWINDLRDVPKVHTTSTGKARVVKLGPASIRYMKAMLSGILNLACDTDAISKNPASRVKVPKALPKRERTLPPLEAMAIRAEVEGTDMACPILLSLYLGLREGEVAGLKWEHLDRQRGELKIAKQRQAQVGKGVVEKDVKSQSFGILQLSPYLVSEIDRCGNLDSEFICTRGGEPWVPKKIYKEWVKLRGQFGLDNWTFHDLRHGAGGLLYATGSDLLQIASVLRHKNPTMSLVYTQTTADRQREGLASLSNALKVSDLVDIEGDKQ